MKAKGKVARKIVSVGLFVAVVASVALLTTARPEAAHAVEGATVIGTTPSSASLGILATAGLPNVLADSVNGQRQWSQAARVKKGMPTKLAVRRIDAAGHRVVIRYSQGIPGQVIAYKPSYSYRKSWRYALYRGHLVREWKRGTVFELTVGNGYKGSWRSARVSWYGPGFYGHGMAGGGILRPNSMIVAHKRLPFGTKVAIKYKGRTTVAVVRDRGPFVAGREFDLGPGVARALGFGGVGKISYCILN